MKIFAYLLWCLGWPLVAKFGFEVNMLKDGFASSNIVSWGIWISVAGSMSDLVKHRFSSSDKE